MNQNFTIYSGFFAATAFVSFFVAALAWNRRSVKGARELILLMIAAGIWSFLIIFETAATSVNGKILWSKLAYFGAVSSPLLFFLFVLRFTGKDKLINLRNIIFLSIFPVATLVLTFTNEYHHLIWTDFSPISVKTNMMEYSHGIGFWIGYVLFSYIMLLLATVLLFVFIINHAKTFHSQAVIVLMAGLLPWTASLIYLTDNNPVPGLDLVPASIIASGVVMAYAILYIRFLDLVPVARETLVETLLDGILSIDGQNRIQDINGAAMRFLGIKDKTVIGMPAGNSGATVVSLMDAAINAEIVDELEVTVNESVRYYNIIKQPIKNHPGSRLIIIRDITERKLQEETLYNERTLFRTIIDLIPDAVYVKDTECRKIFANPREVQLSGKRSEEEIIGKTDFNLYPDAEAKRSGEEDRFVLQTGKPILEVDGYLTDNEGLHHWLLVSKVPLRDQQGKITGLVGVTHDITTRKLIEKKLRESESNFRAFFETMDDMVFIADQTGMIFHANSSVTRKLGYSLEDLKNMFILDLHPEEKRAEAEYIFSEMFKGGFDSCPLPLARKDGIYVPVETRVWFGKWDGKDCIFGISKDLSKEQESLEKFNKIFNNNPALMAISSFPDQIFTEVNNAFLAKTGFSKDEVIGKTSRDLLLFDKSGYQEKMAVDLSKKGSVHNREMKIKTRSGLILDGLFSGEIIENQDKKYLLTVIIDITESKKLEEDIKLQNDFYNIISKVSEKLIQTDSDRLDTEINRSLEMLGTFNKVDRTYVFELDFINDEINNTFEWCAEGVTAEIDNLQGIPFSFIPRWKDTFQQNEHIYIESVSDLPDELILEKEILEPQGIKSLVTVPMYYGPDLIGFLGFDSVSHQKKWSDQVITLLKVFANVLAGVIYKKKTEAILFKAKQEADSANKSKSEFLANMSHEIRTPLNGIIGFTDLLLKSPLNKTQLQYADNVNTAGLSLLGIINDILDFSKIEAGKMELDFISTDIIDLTEQAADIIKYHAAKKKLELLLNIQPDLPRFAITDPVRLRQILVNLLGNAVKFTETGEVELKVTFSKSDEKKGFLSFAVRDTGIGINTEQQSKLFKAFSQADTSTTRKFGGTGLGLTISNMLAEKMGSKIQINSEIGKGSTFFFSIETEFEMGDKLDPQMLSDVKSVLVIDDNDNNRLILEHTFRNWGISYTGVNSGEDAINLIKQPHLFDVIIVDYNMPELNGIDTVRIIRENLGINADKQPIILLHSSSDETDIYNECKKLGIRFNLIKPVKSQELLNYLKNLHSQPVTETKTFELIAHRDSFEISDKISPVILVVEDVTMNMLLVTTLIKQIVPNAVVLKAKNGREAFGLVKENNPALIFMDIQMPEMDGIEATIQIRKLEQETAGHIPIIALTAGAIKGEEEKCREVGMDDFLTKPIAHDALFKVLQKYLTVKLNNLKPPRNV
jgi:PAS domain S-box-containing protein